MTAMAYIRRFVRAFVAALIVLFMGASMALAQTKQLLMWQEEINYLQKTSSDELVGQRAAIVQFRNGIEFWLKHHPSSTVSLPSAPPQPWGGVELRKQVSLLGQAVETIMKEDPSQPFNLGVAAVSHRWQLESC